MSRSKSDLEFRKVDEKSPPHGHKVNSDLSDVSRVLVGVDVAVAGTHWVVDKEDVG